MNAISAGGYHYNDEACMNGDAVLMCDAAIATLSSKNSHTQHREAAHILLCFGYSRQLNACMCCDFSFQLSSFHMSSAMLCMWGVCGLCLCVGWDLIVYHEVLF
jgi:hypothetical protein